MIKEEQFRIINRAIELNPRYAEAFYSRGIDKFELEIKVVPGTI